MEGHLWGGTKFSFLRDIERVNFRIILGAATMVAGVLLITIR